MAPTAHTNLGRRLRLAVACAVVLTALTVASAGASVPTSMGGADTRLSRLGAGVSPTTSPPNTRPRSPIPGFLLDRGRYARFDAPEPVLQTEPASVNNRGEIVGHYMDAAGLRHGFVRDRHGRFTTIDVPGAKTGTVPLRINDRGQIVGRYDLRSVDDPDPRFRGFLLDRGKLVRIDVPGAPRNAVLGLNDRGQLVGYYENTAATANPQPAGTPPMSRML